MIVSNLRRRWIYFLEIKASEKEGNYRLRLKGL